MEKQINATMKYLRLVIAISLAPFTFLFSQDIPSIPFPMEPLTYDTNLVKECVSGKFDLAYRVSKVDTAVISFMLTREYSTCMADPKERFNDTDMKFAFLCNLRLLFAGMSANKKYSFVVFEQGTIGSVKVTAYLFRLEHAKISGVAKLDLAHNLKKYRKFIKALENGEYQYSYQPNLKNLRR